MVKSTPEERAIAVAKELSQMAQQSASQKRSVLSIRRLIDLPLSLMVGQDEIKQALLLAAVNPR
jgi:hypothetical protein